MPLKIPTGNMGFDEVARAAQLSFDQSRALGEVPLYHVLEMEAPPLAPIVLPDRPVPMLSYIDIRRIPFSDLMDGLNVGIWGDNRSSDGVCMWVNRLHDRTQLVIAYPDNPIARDSIATYKELMRSTFARIADGGTR